MNENERKIEKIKKMRILGKIIYYLKIARFWHDGDGKDFLWNLWNPLCWPIILILFIITILWLGIDGLKDFPGISLNKWWKEHKSEREFF